MTKNESAEWGNGIATSDMAARTMPSSTNALQAPSRTQIQPPARAASAQTGADIADAVETLPGPAFHCGAMLGIKLIAAPVPNGDTHNASATLPFAPRIIAQMSDSEATNR